MPSIHSQIENEIEKNPSGKIYFTDDFTHLGTAENIKKILLRLEKEDVLERIAFGIYIKPKIDSLLGVIYPSLEEIAKEIAKRDKARIIPTGTLALYNLGLTTQIPLNVVYLSDGSQRVVKIGKYSIKFKRTVPKTFAIKDELLQLIVQSLKEIGNKNITEEFLLKLKPSIQKVSKEVIDNELKYAPVWIQKEIRNLYKK